MMHGHDKYHVTLLISNRVMKFSAVLSAAVLFKNNTSSLTACNYLTGNRTMSMTGCDTGLIAVHSSH